ncbi:MAG: hypothetical protein WDN30_11280 [Pararobbsia sp.]
MNRQFVFLSVALLLGACSTPAREEAYRTSETQLLEARALARVTCAAPEECDRLWSRTALYVAWQSGTAVLESDAHAITTRKPHSFGKPYFWASRTENEPGGTTIEIRGMCRGMYRSDGRPGWLYETCTRSIRETEINFRKFVEADE